MYSGESARSSEDSARIKTDFSLCPVKSFVYVTEASQILARIMSSEISASLGLLSERSAAVTKPAAVYANETGKMMT